jgi:serine/threonine protein kinase
MIHHISANGKNRPRITTRPEIQKVDIYALGVVVYAMLYGTFPYKGDNLDSILADLGRRKVYFPQTRKQTGQSVSSEAIQFTRWLLEKDPLKRPLAMHALKDGWLTCDTPGGPLTQKPEGSFAEALGEFEEVELVSNLRRQESDLDKAGFEPPIEVVQSIGAALPPPPEPGTPVIMQRKQPIGMKLTFPASKAKK